MQDKDTKLIWEAYSSPGRVGGGSIPFPDGRGEMDHQDPGEDFPTQFGFPYRRYTSNGEYSKPEPEIIDSDHTSGTIDVQGFGPRRATRPLEYPNHNPLGAELEPGPTYNVYVEWDWDGEYDPGGPSSPGTEPYVYNAEVTSIIDENETELVKDPRCAPIIDLVEDEITGTSATMMEVYGWKKPE